MLIHFQSPAMKSAVQKYLFRVGFRGRNIRNIKFYYLKLLICFNVTCYAFLGTIGKKRLWEDRVTHSFFKLNIGHVSYTSSFFFDA